jgi:hypothetical protein
MTIAPVPREQVPDLQGYVAGSLALSWNTLASRRIARAG